MLHVKLSFRLLIFASALLTAVDHTFAIEPSVKALKVGAILGLTGGAAAQADAVKKGLELAVKKLEDEGWVINLQIEDDQTNAAKTVSAVQSLHARGYSFIIGPMWSFQINAAKSVIEQHKMLALIPTSSTDVSGGASKQIFNFCLPRSAQTPLIANWLGENKFKKVLILTPLGDWGVVHNTVFKNAVAKQHGTIVGEGEFNYGLDLSAAKSLLLKYKSHHPDVVLTTGAPPDVATIIRALNELHFDVAILGTQDLSDAINLKLLTAKDLNNKGSVIGLAVEPNFIAAYEQHFKKTPELYADRSYESLLTLATAIEATDGSVEAVREFLAAGKAGLKFDNQGDVLSGRYELRKVVP